MKIKEILSESLTSKVFHYTDIPKALVILKNRKFNLRAATGIEQELGRGKYYFLSLARSPSADYAVQSSYKTGVVFNLNGDWLNRHHKSIPIDYWNRMWWDSHSGKTIGGYRSEQEDRIISNNPHIEFPSESKELVSEIHILFVSEEKDNFSEFYKKAMRSLIFEAKKQGIKLYVYGRREDWLVQNRSKSILSPEFVNSLRPETNSEKIPRRHRSWPERDYFKDWRELYHKTSKKDLSSSADKLRYNVIFGWNDTHSSLEADMHNAKFSDGLNKLIAIFKKIGVKTAKEYVEWLREKWRGINEGKKSKNVPKPVEPPPVERTEPLEWTIESEKKATKGSKKHVSTKGFEDSVEQLEDWIKQQPKIPELKSFPLKFNAHLITHKEHPIHGRKLVDVHLVGSQVVGLIVMLRTGENTAKLIWVDIGSHKEVGI